MKHVLIATILALGAAAPVRAQPGPCPPAGYDRARLEALRQAGWELHSEHERNQLARALTGCLAFPDSALRDGAAFEALAHWLRARLLSEATMLALADDLETRLAAPEGPGFERPFAALVLSEVARADRVQAYLTPQRRAQLLDASIGYFSGVRDYRGFDEREGWRHGVAHGADLLLQLSLNPALGKLELERIRDAIAGQVSPSAHFYVYGEPERLARPINFMAQRGLIPEVEWTRWFAQFPPAQAENLFASQAGLAQRHNVVAFLQSVLINARLSQNTADDVLLPGSEGALRAMP
jgi:hypothetical protein